MLLKAIRISITSYIRVAVPYILPPLESAAAAAADATASAIIIDPPNHRAVPKG